MIIYLRFSEQLKLLKKLTFLFLRLQEVYCNIMKN